MKWFKNRTIFHSDERIIRQIRTDDPTQREIGSKWLNAKFYGLVRLIEASEREIHLNDALTIYHDALMSIIRYLGKMPESRISNTNLKAVLLLKIKHLRIDRYRRLYGRESAKAKKMEEEICDVNHDGIDFSSDIIYIIDTVMEETPSKRPIIISHTDREMRGMQVTDSELRPDELLEYHEAFDFFRAQLQPQELKMFEAILRGLNNDEIAEEIPEISRNSVAASKSKLKSNLKVIYEKFRHDA